MNELELCYHLGELPSAQHRAGLAGLVLMIRELHQRPEFLNREKAMIEIVKNDKNYEELTEFSVKIRCNSEGLKALFDLTYKSFEEQRWTETKIKNPKEVKEIERLDKKTGNPKIVNLYRYDPIVPHGAFLPVWDKSSDHPDEGIWVKLWRDMLWNIVRGVPTTRIPFNNRVNGASYSQDADRIWQELQHPEKVTGQTGQYYLGAMASNAENVLSKDRVRYQFLLQFWPFVAQVYCPAVMDKDGKRTLAGYVLAIPDVANLRNFCRAFKQVLETRSQNYHKWGYLPREAIIDLPEEGALDLLLLLRDRLANEIGNQQIRRTVLGVEIIHAEKVGNSGVKIRSISYVDPITKQIDSYAQIKTTYWCPWFRKQRLLNLLHSQPESDELPNPLLKELPAWHEFDALLSRIPRKWLTDPLFSHDARELFTQEAGVTMKSEIRNYAQIVYRVCQKYVWNKLSKFDIEWDTKKQSYVKSGRPISQKDGDDKKYKIANEAFLAVRSRTENQAFIDYFVSSLYPFVRSGEFTDFADTLFNKTEEIRALTLLALSSQFPIKKHEEEIDAVPADLPKS